MPNNFQMDMGYFDDLNEAADAAIAKNIARRESGLTTDILDVDKFVKLNNLSPVTNPQFLDKNVPTPDGVLSYTIFGTDMESRRSRMAYIDLAPYHYMAPIAAMKLGAYSRVLSQALFSQGRFRVENGTLVSDQENGDSGPEFLYKNWDKLRFVQKTTESTKDLMEFYQQDRNVLFLTKFPVIPAFFRDINTNGIGSGERAATKSSSEINSKYSSIIAYSQTLNTYTDTFTHMSRLTQSRIQTLLDDLYVNLTVQTVKGSPSKFGMLRRAALSKNVNYASRLVLSSPILQKDSFNSVQVKFGYATVPLAYCISSFFPFIVHELKTFFDREFLQGGKLGTKSFAESYDENHITQIITRFLSSPSTRFEPMLSPPDIDGNQYPIRITGRFSKGDTTITRDATITDILYMCTCRACADKHVFITRYPLDNPNGQWPARIIVASTIHTTPATIGTDVYDYFPITDGDPANSFIDTLSFSNTMIGPMGADYDGDTVTLRPVYSKEANAECEARINSIGYLLNVEGKLMREPTKDFIITMTNLTHLTKNQRAAIKPCNAQKPKYQLVQ